MFRVSGLIQAFLSEELSEEHRRELEAWMAESVENRELFKHICAERTMREKAHRYRTEQPEEAFRDFLRRRGRLVLRRRIYRWSIGAAAVLLLAGGWWQWQRLSPAFPDMEVMAREETMTDKAGGRPVLTLASGERMIVPEGTLAFEETEAGQRIIAAGEVLAQSADSTATSATAYNTMEVPPMCDFQLTLSDGTRVWMNAASSLRYPVKFAEDSRTVQVTGEVYLEVAKDARRPFYVEVDGMRVAVLGTCFNVRAYPHEHAVRVTLTEGKVEAEVGRQRYALTPGYQLSRTREAGEVNVRAVDVDDVLAWKRGFYVFKKARLSEVASTLQSWYNVDIVMTSRVSTTTVYTGVVNKEESLDVFLRRLEEVSKVKCLRQENIVLIY